MTRNVALAYASDLTTCDREPIHLLGSTQSHGHLLACEPGTWRITHASANVVDLVPLRMSEILGADLRSVLGAEIVTRFEAPPAVAETDLVVPVRVFGAEIAGLEGNFDVSVHTFDGRTIVEVEPEGARAQEAPLDLVRHMLVRLQSARTLSDLCDQTAGQLRQLIGYDRVMIYRFLPDGSGQVIAEARGGDVEPMLNLRYPASDVPQQARDLYKRNWVRLITDVSSEPVRVLAADGEKRALDLSHADLRAVSPIHIEYLHNMGVGASMSISIIVGGELWGLIACHHKTARPVGVNLRTAAELLGQVFSLQIQTVEGVEAYVTMRAARALLDRVVAEFPVEGSLITNLSARLQQFAAFMPNDGVGIWVDGVFCGSGVTPTADEMTQLTGFLEQSRPLGIFATHTLAEHFEPARTWASGLRGMLAVPLAHSGGNYLFYFRREITQTVQWGGDPNKSLTVGSTGRISPRKSFEAWQQEVRGQSLPWTSRERLIGDTLRVYLLDIIVRFSEVITEERRQAQQRQRLITNELNHRVKGTLELIQSLVLHGYEEPGKVQEFVRTLEGRIKAISLAYDATSTTSASDLASLIERAVALSASRAGRIDIHGPDVGLEAKAFTVMALVIHELATNAAECGALSCAAGKLSVTWFIDQAGRLVLLWEEAGVGQPEPKGDGLGIAIIRRNIPHALGGEADVRFRATGLLAKFVVPQRYLVSSPPPALAAEPRAIEASGAGRQLDGYSILVVEDQMPTALDLERLLVERGAASIRIAGTVEDAVALLSVDVPDVAILDVDLGDSTSFSVAEQLMARSVPFVFAGSEADLGLIPPQFNDVHHVTKPFAAEAVVQQLKDALLPHLIRAVLTRLV